MLVSLRALPAWVGGGLLADLHQASPSTACAPAASVSASSCPGRRDRVGARYVARAVLGVLWRDGLCVLAMPQGSHVVCASGNLSHWIQQVKEKETDTPRKTPGGGTPRSNRWDTLHMVDVGLADRVVLGWVVLGHIPSDGPPDWLGLGRGQRIDVCIDIWLATTRTNAREGFLDKHHVQSD